MPDMMLSRDRYDKRLQPLQCDQLRMHWQRAMQFDSVKGQNREVPCRQSFQLRSPAWMPIMGMNSFCCDANTADASIVTTLDKLLMLQVAISYSSHLR